MAEMVEHQAFWVRCLACEHHWIAAYVPMELGRFARVLKGVCCPACGETGRRIVHAPPKDGA